MSKSPVWGQHFLQDSRILTRIAQKAVDRSGDLVVEIGPGRGALTSCLLAQGARVTAIEIDPELVMFLKEKFNNNENFELLHSDILNVNFVKFITDRTSEPAIVAGNLPYHITSPIIRMIFTAGSVVSRAVLLMQKEEADRVVAQPRSRNYAFLSVLCNLYAQPRRLFHVPARAFRPPPKVNSSAVELVIRQDDRPEPDFIEFLKLCFRHPRKILLNNLSSTYDRDFVAKLAVTRNRAQQLDIQDLLSLWKTLHRYKP